jgi:hypothetical protein
LRRARISLPMREEERRPIFAVREGEVEFNDVLTEIGELERTLEDLCGTSRLPPEPDYGEVNSFLVTAYRGYWS